MKNTTTHRVRLAAAAAAVLLIGACAPGGSSDSGDEAEGDREISTDADLGEVNLVVWDQEVRGGQAEQIEALNAVFEEAHPGVTIERVSNSTEDLETTLRLALTGEDVPDVVQANNNRANMGQYVSADLLTPLDDYAEAYGWTERFPESVRSLASYSEDGAVLGEGTLYGLPQMGEIVGVYYNKATLAELQLEPPTTTEDFEAALAAAEAAGITPIQFGNSEPWAGIHQYGFVQNQVVEPDAIRDLGFGRPGASWTTDENVAAAEKIVSWADSGYFTDGFNGINYDAAWQAFAQDDGLFFVGGTWLVADLTGAMGDNVGFTLPPAGESGQHTVTGGVSIPWAIPSGSENADAAAAYIDFITSEDAMTAVAEAGNLPVVDSDQQEATGLQAEVFAAWAQAGEEDLLVPYLDYATETFYDTLTAGVSSLLGAQVTPEQFLDTLEADYAAATAG